MAIADFITTLHDAMPDVSVDPRDLQGLDAFSFVSAVVVPPYLSALQGVRARAEGATEQLFTLSGVVEAGFTSESDELVDALAMRLVERHLCRDPEMLACARPYLGPATRDVVRKLSGLIDSADRRVAAHRAS